MSDCVNKVWWNLLCSDESWSAGLRHASPPLFWDRAAGYQSPLLSLHTSPLRRTRTSMACKVLLCAQS